MCLQFQANVGLRSPGMFGSVLLVLSSGALLMTRRSMMTGVQVTDVDPDTMTRVQMRMVS